MVLGCLYCSTQYCWWFKYCTVLWFSSFSIVADETHHYCVLSQVTGEQMFECLDWSRKQNKYISSEVFLLPVYISAFVLWYNVMSVICCLWQGQTNWQMAWTMQHGPVPCSTDAHVWHEWRFEAGSLKVTGKDRERKSEGIWTFHTEIQGLMKQQHLVAFTKDLT